MTKVLFVYHNDSDESFLLSSLAVLGGVARDYGAESRLFDTSFWIDKDSKLMENNRQVKERTGEFRKQDDYSPERRVVDLKEEFLNEVNDYKPDLIAATATSQAFDLLTDFILPAKKKYNIPIIIGGSHPTVSPEESIRKSGVDIICIGEGEKALLELLKRIEQKRDYFDIPNLWVKTSEGKIIKNKLGPLINLDETPEPNWDIFNPLHRIRPFQGKVMNYGYFEISRGCPSRCSYCINSCLHELYKNSGISSKAFRFHSPEVIVGRMKKLKEKYGFNHVQFVDENLTVMPTKSLEKLAELYSRDVGVGFYTMGRPETLIVNPEKVKILKYMGCKMFALGAESGNERLRRTILKRPMKEGVLEKAAELLKEQDIMISLFNIIGFPTETKEMIFDTIELNRRIQPVRNSVRFLVPYKGTEIRDYCVREGYITDDYENKIRDISCLLEPVLTLPSPPHPTKQELIKIRDNFQKYVYMPEKNFNEVKKEWGIKV